MSASADRDSGVDGRVFIAAETGDDLADLSNGACAVIDEAVVVIVPSHTGEELVFEALGLLIGFFYVNVLSLSRVKCHLYVFATRIKESEVSDIGLYKAAGVGFEYKGVGRVLESLEVDFLLVRSLALHLVEYVLGEFPA